MKFIAGIWIVIIISSIIPIIIIIAARVAIIAIVIVGAIGCYRSAKRETYDPRAERKAGVIIMVVPPVAMTPGRAMMPASIATPKPVIGMTWPSLRRRGRQQGARHRQHSQGFRETTFHTEPFPARKNNRRLGAIPDHVAHIAQQT